MYKEESIVSKVAFELGAGVGLCGLVLSRTDVKEAVYLPDYTTDICTLMLKSYKLTSLLQA